MANMTVEEWAGLSAEELAAQDARNASELDTLLRISREENQPAEVGTTLAEIAATPQGLDMWPGHCYVPPKIIELEFIIPLANEMGQLFASDLLGAVQRAVQIVMRMARRVTASGELAEVTEHEVKTAFDHDEIAAVIQHMLTKQGLEVVDPKKGGFAILTGVRSFERSAAITPVTT